MYHFKLYNIDHDFFFALRAIEREIQQNSILVHLDPRLSITQRTMHPTRFLFHSDTSFQITVTLCGKRPAYVEPYHSAVSDTVARRFCYFNNLIPPMNGRGFISPLAALMMPMTASTVMPRPQTVEMMLAMLSSLHEIAIRIEVKMLMTML